MVSVEFSLEQLRNTTQI